MTADDIRRMHAADTLGRQAIVTESPSHYDAKAWWPYPGGKGGILAFASTAEEARREIGLRMLDVIERGGDEASYIEYESIAAFLASREVAR